MISGANSETLSSIKSSGVKTLDPLKHLEIILESYIDQHENLSVNGFSKRCGVSEATVRRIHSKNAKRVPTLTTVIKILSYISKKTELEEIFDFFPGPLSIYLKEEMPSHPKTEFLDNAVDLSNKLQEPIKYMIYKMASNSKGLSSKKIVEHFGNFGLSKVDELISDNLITKTGANFYHAEYKNFRLSHDCFKDHLKATADFIKPEKLPLSPIKSSQMFYNCSESINIEAYETILKIQRSALKKIRKVLWDPKSEGEISTFVIGAIDTLDSDSAYEISQKTSKNKNPYI